MTCCVAGRGREWRDACEGSERGFGADAASVRERTDQDGCRDGADSSVGLQTRRGLVGELVELAVVLGEQLGLLENGLSEPAALAASDAARSAGVVSSGSPGGDLAKVSVREWVTGVDAEVCRP